MTSNTVPVTCDVVGCHQPAVGRYLHLRQGRALEFQVCRAHFDRIEGGETPDLLAPERVDVAKADVRPALRMDAD